MYNTINNDMMPSKRKAGLHSWMEKKLTKLWAYNQRMQIAVRLVRSWVWSSFTALYVQWGKWLFHPLLNLYVLFSFYSHGSFTLMDGESRQIIYLYILYIILYKTCMTLSEVSRLQPTQNSSSRWLAVCLWHIESINQSITIHHALSITF